MHRTEVENHQHAIICTSYDCALCGLHKVKMRGRHSCIKWLQCSVNLCCKIVGEYRKPCWDVCHLLKKPSPREKTTLKSTDTLESRSGYDAAPHMI